MDSLDHQVTTVFHFVYKSIWHDHCSGQHSGSSKFLIFPFLFLCWYFHVCISQWVLKLSLGAHFICQRSWTKDCSFSSGPNSSRGFPKPQPQPQHQPFNSLESGRTERADPNFPGWENFKSKCYSSGSSKDTLCGDPEGHTRLWKRLFLVFCPLAPSQSLQGSLSLSDNSCLLPVEAGGERCSSRHL